VCATHSARGGRGGLLRSAISPPGGSDVPASLLTSVLVRRPRRHRGALALPRIGQRPELRDLPIAIVGLFVMPGRPHLVRRRPHQHVQDEATHGQTRAGADLLLSVFRLGLQCVAIPAWQGSAPALTSFPASGATFVTPSSPRRRRSRTGIAGPGWRGFRTTRSSRRRSATPPRRGGRRRPRAGAAP